MADGGATKPMFRREAVQAYLAGEPEGGILSVAPPRLWVLFLTLFALVVAAVLGAFVGHVEQTSRGRGILRPAGGVRPLATQIAGTVVAVEVASGDTVVEGQIVARLQSTGLETDLAEARDHLDLAEADLARFDREQRPLMDRRAALLDQQAQLLEKQMKSQDVTIDRLTSRVPTAEALRASGVVSLQSLDDAHEQLEQARRQRTSMEQGLAQNRLDLNGADAALKDERWRLEQAVGAARARRDALQLALEQTTVRAPQGGTLEAVLVRPGDLVAAGAPVGKLLPSRLPTQVVSFLPEKDRAFVTPGQLVHIEIDQLPYSEFGSLVGRVERVSQDLASTYEIHDAFGDAVQVPGATFRVELSIDDDDASKRLAEQLRPGMLADVRYTLRSRTVITLVLDPLRKWWK